MNVICKKKKKLQLFNGSILSFGVFAITSITICEKLVWYLSINCLFCSDHFENIDYTSYIYIGLYHITNHIEYNNHNNSTLQFEIIL